jgi:hypothetical protein
VYLRLSIGAGYLGVHGNGPSGSASLSGAATSLMFALGGTPLRGLSIAFVATVDSLGNASFNGAPTSDGSGWSADKAMLGAMVDWFPDVHRGWHVGGALGFESISVSNDASQISWSGGGLGGNLLGGYDFWLGPEWSLGIQGVLSATANQSMQDDTNSSVGYQFGAVGFGVQVALLAH